MKDFNHKLAHIQKLHTHTHTLTNIYTHKHTHTHKQLLKKTHVILIQCHLSLFHKMIANSSFNLNIKSGIFFCKLYIIYMKLYTSISQNILSITHTHTHTHTDTHKQKQGSFFDLIRNQLTKDTLSSKPYKTNRHDGICINLYEKKNHKKVHYIYKRAHLKV